MLIYNLIGEHFIAPTLIVRITIKMINCQSIPIILICSTNRRFSDSSGLYEVVVVDDDDDDDDDDYDDDDDDDDDDDNLREFAQRKCTQY